MVQILYSIAAIMLLGITVLNINVKIHGTEERMMFSELSLETTSVGAEILNEVGRLDYDQSATFGQVLPVASLEDDATWGTGGCNLNTFALCQRIGDVQGKDAVRTVSRMHAGTTYDVEYNVTDLNVCYANVTPPHDCTPGTKSYAKKVTLNVSTPALVDGNGNPYEIPMSRVYMYPNF